MGATVVIASAREQKEGLRTALAGCDATRTQIALALVLLSWRSSRARVCSTPPVGAARRRPCPAFMPAVLLATRGCAIQLTRRRWRRSSR